MLRKTSLSMLTALTTALSALTPLSVSASPVQTPMKSDINVIPANYTRAYAGEQDEYTQTATSIPDDFQLAYTEPESGEATIHNRLYTVTTAGKQGETTADFPIKDNRAITVNVVDSKTGEPIEDVQVRFVETEAPDSKVIKRDFGIWTTTETGTFTLPNISYTLEDTSSMFLLTAVLKHIPEEYTYRGNETMIIDHIVDAGDWHIRNEDFSRNTNTLTISLDRAYEKHFNASCSIIDSTTGKQVEGAHMVFSGPLGCRKSWYTSGDEPHIIEDIRCLLYQNEPEAVYNLETYSLPEGYMFDYSRESKENIKITPDFSGDVELVVYVVPTNQTQPIKTTGPELPSINTTTTTTTTTEDTNTTQTTEKEVSSGTRHPIYTTTATGDTDTPVNTTLPAPDSNGKYTGHFTAMCFAIDIITGEKISGAELQLYDNNNACIIESWTSSDKCGHQIDIDYVMDSPDSYKTYQLAMLNIPEGYTNEGNNYYTAEDGFIPYYNKIEYGFKGIATFAVYVCPEDYVFPESGIKPWQTTGKPENTTTTASNDPTVTITATTLAEGKLNLNSAPKKTQYTIGEKLDLTGLDVSMTHELGVNGKDGVDLIFNHVNPSDYPEAFIVNTHEFDSTKAGTYTIKVKCTDDYKSDYRVMHNLLTFTVTVSEKETFSDKIGDSDGDGNVGINDAVLIMQYIANPDKYQMSKQGKLNADVYNRGDGITASDALTIQMVECKTISQEDLPVAKQ
ncbi:MAG: bacterial Ig-like domain-containing protein [Ruminococcus sp.]|nr:bacterial Ig-like domain-containing protein [Ruminococcus sp.]